MSFMCMAKVESFHVHLIKKRNGGNNIMSRSKPFIR